MIRITVRCDLFLGLHLRKPPFGAASASWQVQLKKRCLGACEPATTGHHFRDDEVESTFPQNMRNTRTKTAYPGSAISDLSKSVP